MPDISNSDQVSHRVQHMVTWQIFAELMRRHRQQMDLRVLELHPAGGMGDSFYLYRWGPNGTGTSLNDFRRFRRMGEGAPKAPLEVDGGYVWPWLAAEGPKPIVDAVEQVCGLPSHTGHLPPSDSTTKAIRLMARVLMLCCGTRRNRQWRSALLDASDGGGARPRQAFTNLPHVAQTVPQGAPYTRLQRYWLLVAGPTPFWDEPGPAELVVDLNGEVWFGGSCTRRENIAALIKRAGGYSAAAELILD